MRTFVFAHAAIALAACGTSPRAADGPLPSLAASDSINTNGKPRVDIVETAPPPGPWQPPRHGPFCAELKDPDDMIPKTGICDNLSDDAGTP